VAAERHKSQAKTGEPEPIDQPKDKRVDYLTTRQLAEVLQISEGTVHRLRRAGRIPAVQLTDKLIRFNLRDVQRALRQHSGLHSDDTQSETEQGPIPQLSFGDVYPDFGEEH
jgi:excisionase family DNA binding protein